MVLLAAKSGRNLSGHVALLLGGLTRWGGGGLSVGHSSPLLCIVSGRALCRNASCTRTGGRGANRARAGGLWAWGGKRLGTGGFGWFWHWKTQTTTGVKHGHTSAQPLRILIMWSCYLISLQVLHFYDSGMNCFYWGLHTDSHDVLTQLNSMMLGF